MGMLIVVVFCYNAILLILVRMNYSKLEKQLMTTHYFLSLQYVNLINSSHG